MEVEVVPPLSGSPPLLLVLSSSLGVKWMELTQDGDSSYHTTLPGEREKERESRERAERERAERGGKEGVSRKSFCPHS